MENTGHDVIERLVRIETKIDTFQKDIESVEHVSKINENNIIAMQQRLNNLEGELKEIQDRAVWNSRAVLGCVITTVGGVILAIIKYGLGV